MSADDIPSYPLDPAYPPDSDPASPYTPGNRPASGARRATPGEVLSHGFSGDQNAGDFLGLDVEFTGSQEPGTLAGGLELQSAPSTHVAADDGSSVYAPEAIPAAGEEAAFSQGPSAFEFGEDLGGEDLEPDVAGKRRAFPVLAAALVVGLLAAGGFVYGPDLYTRLTRGGDDVARRDGGPAPQAPVRRSGSAAERAPDRPVAPDPDPSTSPVVMEPSERSQDPVELADGASAVIAPAAPPTAAAGESESASPERPELVAGLLSAPPAPAADASETMGFPDLTSADYEWTSEDKLELIWRGSAVPMEAVFAPARTLMPRVGNVRVLTTSGDVFEGRLYAVGQERVWIDAAPGRIGLDGKSVERIETLVEEPRHQGSAGPAPSGKRVRVRVPGGVLYGRVLKLEGEEVILALDDGGKVRVKSVDVEELGSGRAVVVHR